MELLVELKFTVAPVVELTPADGDQKKLYCGLPPVAPADNDRFVPLQIVNDEVVNACSKLGSVMVIVEVFVQFSESVITIVYVPAFNPVAVCVVPP